MNPRVIVDSTYKSVNSANFKRWREGGKNCCDASNDWRITVKSWMYCCKHYRDDRSIRNQIMYNIENCKSKELQDRLINLIQWRYWRWGEQKTLAQWAFIIPSVDVSLWYRLSNDCEWVSSRILAYLQHQWSAIQQLCPREHRSAETLSEDGRTRIQHPILGTSQTDETLVCSNQ